MMLEELKEKVSDWYVSGAVIVLVPTTCKCCGAMGYTKELELLMKQTLGPDKLEKERIMAYTNRENL